MAIFKKVVIPFTLPYMMTGIRIGLGVAWMCIIAAEMIMAVGGGIGYYIWYYGFNGPYDNFFAGVIVLAVLGIITVGLAEYAEKYILKAGGGSDAGDRPSEQDLPQRRRGRWWPSRTSPLRSRTASSFVCWDLLDVERPRSCASSQVWRP